ncbi:MAG: signal peptidase I [archaeon]|nr:MAG: signal peptidase I [archaeon]
MGIWNFLWKSNSLLSWIIDIILIFLIIKFIIFPGAGLILGTSMPFVIVESGSMHHEGSFDNWFELHGQWYLDNNITKNEIKEYWPYTNGMNKGDIITVKGSKEYKKGQVIVFKAQGKSTPVIHRIIYVGEEDGETFYATKGDHNDGQLIQELKVEKDQIIGKAIGKIPALGWIKLIFVGVTK